MFISAANVSKEVFDGLAGPLGNTPLTIHFINRHEEEAALECTGVTTQQKVTYLRSQTNKPVKLVADKHEESLSFCL